MQQRIIGPRQRAALEWLVRAGEWHPGCNFHVANESKTVTIFESLVSRGLAACKQRQRRSGYGMITVYVPTDAGRLYAGDGR